MKIILCLLLCFNVYAKEVAGVNVPETQSVNSEKLLLNGIGIRKATWFKVKVYVGSLYLKEKTTDVKKILEQAYPKLVTMDFVYGVDKKKLVGGWNDAFKDALSSKDKALETQSIAAFNGMMEDMKRGESIRIEFLSDGVNVSIKGKPAQMIKSKTFAKNLLSVWFINPRDKGLAKGMQGLP